ncbi:MAG TPA: DUF5309 family protein [Tepidisphaeraceae bacterium]|nr:DUF5309 family protein [Tepidisphaeraceae bacterium]
MPFTGKATYAAGAALPELAEDVSDLVALNSPHETPLLDALGDPPRAAHSTVHEWVEDALLPNTAKVNDATYADPATDAQFVVDAADRFRVGDQVKLEDKSEVMLVTAVNVGTNTLTVVRGYGGSTPAALSDGATVVILGNAALEGDDASAARFTNRSRKTNYTQIFAATVDVSGSQLAVQHVGVADELEYQKQQRARELIRDLENSVINGRAAAASPEGSGTVRRTMKGLLSLIATNRFAVGAAGFPADPYLTEEQLNTALGDIWRSSSGRVDLIVVGGRQKRSINGFGANQRRFAQGDESYKRQVSIYESDYGVCQVVLCRWVPAGTVLLLDSSRIDVLPLAGRSFHYKPLASVGDRTGGQLIGEYTLELRNENAHGVITGLE